MKIFHTSDWHIGKLLHKENLISEQREVLIKFLDDIDRKKPDIVIVAGDIYDTSIPRIEAIELLDEQTTENPVAYPPKKLLDKCETFIDLDDKIKLYDRAWIELKSK